MQQRVLAPLGMTSSSFAWTPALGARLATPYGADGKPRPQQMPDDVAADALLATAPDIARFVAAPLPDKRQPTGGGVLDPSTVSDVYFNRYGVPHVHMSAVVPDEPGLGYFVEEAKGAPPLITNAGVDPGWTSLFVVSPTTGDGIVVLTNSDAGAPAIAQILTLWSSWRGLPTANVVSGYRVAGLTGAAFLSLIVAYDIACAAGLVLERRRRRVGLATGSTFVGAVLELALASVVLVIWTGALAASGHMPVLHGVGTFVIGALAALAVARALFPLRADAPAGARAVAGMELAAGT
jgi:CubicO group peptidase (beta-lactamase class C family)